MKPATSAPRPRSGAALHRGSSRQDWGTPPEFLDAVRARFGALDWDLAAHRKNAVSARYLGPGSHYSDDSLAVVTITPVSTSTMATWKTGRSTAFEVV